MSDVPVDVSSDAPADPAVTDDPAVEAAQAALAAAEKDAEAAHGTVRVRLAAIPGSTFDTGVDGVEVLGFYPVEVPAADLPAVQAAADRSAVRLILEGEA